MKRMSRSLVIGTMIVGLLTGTPAFAVDGVRVSDASKLLWVIDGNRLYLRNLDAFGAGWQGCCYAYWIDLGTDNGKSQYSALLTFYAARLPISIYKDDKTTAGPIGFLGPT